MIVVDGDRQDVTIGGALDVNTFTIKASASAFRILSASLYSNKLGAMIRELSTNADDAHKMAGKDGVPFLITLPNSFEPSFKIRDYGTGLSEEQIMNIYTTFFESTKTESNDVVGCLGLGSKSPFGVADSFTITSFYNGERTVYSAFLDATGIPSIATFFKEETSEENGIEIEVAIKAEDFSTFPKEVNRQLRYFKVKPTIQGNTGFQWDNEEQYLFEGTNWKMTDVRQHAKVVQGQISYPIDVNAMGSKYNDLDDVVKTVFRMPIVFEVPIGDVNIAPSREALTYDDATITNLIKAAELILAELPPIIAKKVKLAKTEWDARLTFNTVMNSISDSSSLRKKMLENKSLLWKGIDVSEMEMYIPENLIISNHSYSNSYKSRNKKESRSAYAHYDKISRQYTTEKFWNIRVRPMKDVLFIHLVPDSKGLEGRIKQYIADTHFNGDIHVITTLLSISELETLLKGPKVLDSSTFDKVRRDPVVKRDEKIILLQKYNHGWTKTDSWDDVEVTEEELKELSGLYVTLDRFDVVYEDNKYGSFREHVSAARTLKIIDKDTEIYGIRSLNKNLVHPFVCFYETAKTTVIETPDTPMYSFGTVSKFENMFRDRISAATEMIKHIPLESPMYKILDAIIKNSKFKMDWHTEKFINAFSLNLGKIDISDVAKVASERYDMLPDSSVSYGYDTKKAADYVNKMDLLHTLTYIHQANPLEALIGVEA